MIRVCGCLTGFEVRGLGFVSLLVEVVLVVELQHKIAVHRRGIASGVFG